MFEAWIIKIPDDAKATANSITKPDQDNIIADTTSTLPASYHLVLTNITYHLATLFTFPKYNQTTSYKYPPEMAVLNIDEEDNLARMRRGDLYYAFTPELVAARQRCKRAVARFNAAEDLTRREMAEHWRE